MCEHGFTTMYPKSNECTIDECRASVDRSSRSGTMWCTRLCFDTHCMKKNRIPVPIRKFSFVFLLGERVRCVPRCTSREIRPFCYYTQGRFSFTFTIAPWPPSLTGAIAFARAVKPAYRGRVSEAAPSPRWRAQFPVQTRANSPLLLKISCIILTAAGIR